ncbi:hypothetical protein C2G38_2223264 [Gigaspora rosea]|uniref:Uncharacterized protein n=1 Tax=Gigaspora rosea TaxID=44941 RepID=A0A397U1I0_9GLOM|nr:hypothetical protein C2G38_2223264 [Gigaspora rosea]
MSDQVTQPWNLYEMQLILQAELDVLSENDIDSLQAILDESFDTSHSDDNQKYTLAILQRNFTVLVDFCQKCLHIKHQEELNANQEYYDDSQFYQLQQQVQQQDQLIKQLQARIETLKTTNAALLCFFQKEAQNAHQQANTGQNDAHRTIFKSQYPFDAILRTRNEARTYKKEKLVKESNRKLKTTRTRKKKLRLINSKFQIQTILEKKKVPKLTKVPMLKETQSETKKKPQWQKKNKRQRVPKKTSSTTPMTELNINNRTTEINDFKPKEFNSKRTIYNDARNESSPQ